MKMGKPECNGKDSVTPEWVVSVLQVGAMACAPGICHPCIHVSLDEPWETGKLGQVKAMKDLHK